jgi:MSHA biogenesis protein MshQ
MKISKWLKQIVIVASFVTVSANASLISGSLNVDNGFFAYISTSDDEAGTLVSEGSNWGVTNSFDSYNLDDGVNYFLHVNALDWGYLAGFLGEFTLTGTDHLFSNNTQTALTNSDDWNVSKTGWENYLQASTYGSNGVTPWGNRAGVDENAQWIWSDTNNVNGPIDAEVFFSIAINSISAQQAAQIPEPTSIAIFALGLLGLVARKVKK